MTDTALPHALDRTIVIRARRETVFRYFTDSLRWAQWWGAGSMIDPEVGGKLFVRYPNAVEAAHKAAGSWARSAGISARRSARLSLMFSQSSMRASARRSRTGASGGSARRSNRRGDGVPAGGAGRSSASSVSRRRAAFPRP